jgi:hypothetical protein
MIDELPPTAPKALPKCYMPPPTADAVIAMYEAMIGRAMTDERKIAMRTKYAALEARRARDGAGVDRGAAGVYSRSLAAQGAAGFSPAPPASATLRLSRR